MEIGHDGQGESRRLLLSYERKVKKNLLRKKITLPELRHDDGTYKKKQNVITQHERVRGRDALRDGRGAGRR